MVFFVFAALKKRCFGLELLQLRQESRGRCSDLAQGFLLCLRNKSVVLHGGDLAGLLEALYRDDHILNLHLKETVDHVNLLFLQRKCPVNRAGVFKAPAFRYLYINIGHILNVEGGLSLNCGAGTDTFQCSFIIVVF